MENIEKAFTDYFAHWDIRLPPEAMESYKAASDGRIPRSQWGSVWEVEEERLPETRVLNRKKRVLETTSMGPSGGLQRRCLYALDLGVRT